ncbi:MAG: AMP-binding protein [Fluviicola sp.]|nr:AMP-binding protein [Fluviicola sp.]
MQITFLTENLKLKNEVRSFVLEWENELPYIETRTSGSTGEAKTIRIEKKYMLASAKMTGDFLQLEKDMNCLLCLSPETIGGKMMIVRTIVLEMNLLVADLSSTPLLGIENEIHFAAMVPLQVSSSLTHSAEQVKKIGKLIIGGGVVSEELMRAIENFPRSVYQTFGMTETISHVAMRKLSAGEKKYTALPSVSFSEKKGELIIDAPQLGVEKLATNDIVELIDATSFHWVGRSDFIINSAGIKHSPEKIEQEISVFLKNNYFIVGLPDNFLGEKIVLCIEGDSVELKTSTFSSILTKYQIPKEIYHFEQFLRTPSGKINRIETLKTISDAKKQIL